MEFEEENDLQREEESNLINLQYFLDTRLALVRQDYFQRNKDVDELIQNDMRPSLPDPGCEKLKEICDPDLLNPDEAQGQINSRDDLDADSLYVLNFLKNIYQNPTKRIQPHEIKFVKNMTKLNEQEPEEGDTIVTPDVILTVQISHPLNVNIRKLAWSEEFLVLGQNYLTELKDKISCFRNETRLGEFSENPDNLENAPVLKDIVKSGYFYIENLILNDLRFNNIDCSSSILKWAEEKNIGNLDAKAMESTRFIDLSIRLGYPYLYNHLGNCEHLVLFTSVKLINPSSDSYIRSSYPIIRERARGRYTFCWCCNKIYAKWIVTNSQYSVDDPTFLCERCLRNTHYLDNNEEENSSSSGILYNKIFDFKAYHYSQL